MRHREKKKQEIYYCLNWSDFAWFCVTNLKHHWFCLILQAHPVFCKLFLFPEVLLLSPKKIQSNFEFLL